MYKRFLNNADYLGIITEEALSQLIRGKDERLAQAEEAAESSLVEYLTENYEIEKALAVGKSLLEYNNQITYPVGSHFYLDHKIVEAIRTINGRKAPFIEPYWEEYTDMVNESDTILQYSQTQSYLPGDIVVFCNVYYKCLRYNGKNYNDIRIPGINAWTRKEGIFDWEANVQHALWDVAKFEGNFYTLINLVQEDYTPAEGEETTMDLTLTPYESPCWGLIGEYDADYSYELTDHEYVVLDGVVFYPTMNPNSDTPEEGFNVQPGDPRNSNVKKHMLRLALYELHKLISPNNVSSARITDYETSIKWLRDASKLIINPQIPRKMDEDKKPVADFAVATFMRDYNPNQNPWQI